MAAQLQQAQKDEETTGAYDQSNAADALPTAEQVPAGGVILPVQKPDTELTAEEQKSRLAKAEAMYGAIVEAAEAADDPDKKVSRRA